LSLARLGFVACGLGFLSKGLIGIVLPGMVIGVWLMVTGHVRKLLRFPWVSGLLLFFGMALPWMMQMQSQFPNFFDYFIVGQHFSRFTGAQFNSQQPWWFYLPVIGIFMFPWVFWVAWDAASRWRAGFSFQKLRRTSMDPWQVLPWVWLLVILVFFSMPKSKLMGYILPVIPPAAMLIVRSWDRLMGNRKSANFWFWMVCGLSASLAVGANFLARYNSMKDTSLDATHVLRCLMQPDDKVYVAGNYPYDLPFEGKLQQPLIIVQDWDDARRNAADDWRRIFFEGADFDLQAGQVLQNMQSLQDVPPNGKSWLMTPAEFQMEARPHAWQLVFKGRAWWLWRAGGAAIPLNPACSVNTQGIGSMSAPTPAH